jgi:hypothetical protein
MPLNDRQTWALLRELDDPDHLEFPVDYDRPAALTRFKRLATRLNDRFHCTCTFDCHVEDASYFGTITIPKSATFSKEHITVTISNFGNLAVVTLGNPGTYNEEEEEGLFQRDDRQRIEDELKKVGYIVVSEHLLWTTYDGVADLASHYPGAHPPTWWTRFFDYL